MKVDAADTVVGTFEAGKIQADATVGTVSVAIGHSVYLDPTTSKLELADDDAVGTVGLYGIALEAGDADATVAVCLNGPCEAKFAAALTPAVNDVAYVQDSGVLTNVRAGLTYAHPIARITSIANYAGAATCTVNLDKGGLISEV